MRTALLLTAVLAGCAVQQPRLSDENQALCKRWVETEIHDFWEGQRIKKILTERGISGEQCYAAVARPKPAYTPTPSPTSASYASSNGGPSLEALALAAALLSNRPYRAQAKPANVIDYEWDWDQFFNQYRQLVWACRGVQTGQFAPEEKCGLKPKLDLRWPGLEYRP